MNSTASLKTFATTGIEQKDNPTSIDLNWAPPAYKERIDSDTKVKRKYFC
jgi:hypothetical protein